MIFTVGEMEDQDTMLIGRIENGNEMFIASSCF